MGPTVWASAEPMTLSVAIATLVAIVAGVVVAAGGILLSWLNAGGRLVKRVDELTSQVFQAQTDRMECERRAGATDRKLQDALHDITAYQRRIERLESATGLGYPSQSVPGILIASLDGMIIEFSPSLTGMLGWTPDEMRGTSVERLVPPELLEEHRAGFAHARVPGAAVGGAKKIHTYALDRNGRRVPVTIAVRKWAEGGFMTALFMARPSAEAEAAEKKAGGPGRQSTSVEDVIPGGKP